MVLEIRNYLNDENICFEGRRGERMVLDIKFKLQVKLNFLLEY